MCYHKEKDYWCIIILSLKFASVSVILMHPFSELKFTDLSSAEDVNMVYLFTMSME
jgi:hypothetical protein